MTMKMLPSSSARTSVPSRFRRLLAACLLPLVAAGLFVAPASAQTITSAVPGLISYQGKVSNAAGALVGTGTPVNRLVIFRIWSHQSNSTISDLVYSEQQTVTVSEGEFSVLIGQGTVVSGTPLGYVESSKGIPTVTVGSPAVFGAATRYLGVTIDDGNGNLSNDPEISPRQQLVSSAFAFRAKYAESVGSNGASTLTALDSGNVGIGTSTPNAALDVNGGFMIRSALTNLSSRPAVGAGRLPAEINGYSSTSPFQNDGFLRLSAGGGTDAAGKTFIDLSGFSTVPDMNANLVFGTAGTERMRINNSGVDVNGGFTIKGALTNGSTRPAVGSSRLAAEIAGYSSVGAAGDDGFLRLSAGGGTNGSAKTFIDLSGFSTVGDMNANLVFGTAGAERMRIDSSGNVGIGFQTPSARLHVGGAIAASASTTTHIQGAYLEWNKDGSSGLTYLLNQKGGGPGGIIFGEVSTANAITERMRIDGSGNVGIGHSNPNSKLAVNSTTAGATLSQTAIFQALGINSGASPSHIHYGTTGDIYWRSAAAAGFVFLQDTGGTVAVGQNVGALAKLTVHGIGNHTIGAHGNLTTGGAAANITGTFNFTDVSIYANNIIHAAAFRAFSDARIKQVQGRSNGAADLALLNQIEITDYTYVDKATKGARPQKKVIGQQIESVFPQAIVHATDVVPDIYKKAAAKDGWVELATNLKVGERVRLVAPKSEKVYDVLEVQPTRFRTSFTEALDDLFVYGREVKDFRVVDYEAIAMLNVSATQEIKREKDAEVAALRAQNAELLAANSALERRLADVETKDRVRDAKLASIEKLLQSSSTVMALPAKPATASGQQ